MEFLLKDKKSDWCKLAAELGFEVSVDDNVIELREMLTKYPLFMKIQSSLKVYLRNIINEIRKTVKWKKKSNETIVRRKAFSGWMGIWIQKTEIAQWKSW